MCSQTCFAITVVLSLLQIHGQTLDIGPASPDSQNLAAWRKCIAASGPLYEEGNFREAARVLEEAVHYAERFPALDRRRPRTIHALAFLYQEQGRYTEAANLYLRAIRLWQQIGPTAQEDLLQSTDNLIGTYLQVENYSAARKLLQVRLREMKGATTKPEDRATLLNTQATLAVAQRHYADAERLYRESLALWEELGPAFDKNAAIVLLNRVTSLTPRTTTRVRPTHYYDPSRSWRNWTEPHSPSLHWRSTTPGCSL